MKDCSRKGPYRIIIAFFYVHSILFDKILVVLHLFLLLLYRSIKYLLLGGLQYMRQCGLYGNNEVAIILTMVTLHSSKDPSFHQYHLPCVAWLLPTSSRTRRVRQIHLA